MILHRGHDFGLDWWTVGVLTYEMLDGDPPFTGQSEMEVYGKVTRQQYKCPETFPADAVDAIALLLKQNPEQRLGNLRNGASDVMAHQWFHGFGWDALLDERLDAPYVPPALPKTDDITSEKVTSQLNLKSALKDADEAGFWPGW